MTPNPSSYDSSYHSRHSQRAVRKAKMIAGRIGQGSSIVDIGCNAGLISKALLEYDVAGQVTGVEIDGSILHPTLQMHPAFSLIEREIQDTTFSETYDSAIYLSVHHHVAAHHGIDVAVRTLRHIASHCRKNLFFETGKVSEGSYWPWQEKLRQHFRFDEEHYSYLFRCLEDLIDDFRIIGYNRIHGIRREIFELRMKSNAEREGLKRRSQGRRYPLVLSSGDHRETLSTGPLTAIARVQDETGRALFWKDHLSNPLGNYREHEISSGLNRDWAVGSLGIHPDGGMMFPLLENVEGNLSSRLALARSERQSLARRLQSIRKELNSTQVAFSAPFRPEPVDECPYDVCDLNPSNILVTRSDTGDPEIRVVDFAYQSPSYRWKNDLNFAHAFTNLGESPLLQIRLRLSGSTRLLVKLVSHQFLTRRQRILNRFPSLFGALFTEAASRLGAPLRRFRRPERA